MPDLILDETGVGILDESDTTGTSFILDERDGLHSLTLTQGSVVKSVSIVLLGLALTVSQGAVSASGGDGVKLLTGLASTGAVGTLVPQQTRILSGQVLTGSPGTLLSGRPYINSARGTVTLTSDVPVESQLLTGSQGLVFPSALVGSNLTIPLLTHVSSVEAGTLVAPAERALTGVVITSATATLVLVLRPTDIGLPAITSASGVLIAQGNNVTVTLFGRFITSQPGVLQGYPILFGHEAVSAEGSLTASSDRALTGQLISSGMGVLQIDQGAYEDTYIQSEQGLLEVSALELPPLIGLESVSALGSVAVTADLDEVLTGLASVSAAGTLTLTLASPPLQGEDAIFALGTLSAPGNVELTGLQITSAQGTLFTVNDRDVALTGLSASGGIGAVHATVRPILTGITMTSNSGVVSLSTDFTRALTGLSTTLAGGVLLPLADRTFMLTGLMMTAQQGLLFANVDGTIALLGLTITSAQGAVGAPNVYMLTGMAITMMPAALSHPSVQSFAVDGHEAIFLQGTLTPVGGDVGTPSGSTEGCHVLSHVAQEHNGIISETAEERETIHSGMAMA